MDSGPLDPADVPLEVMRLSDRPWAGDLTESEADAKILACFADAPIDDATFDSRLG